MSGLKEFVKRYGGYILSAVLIIFFAFFWLSTHHEKALEVVPVPDTVPSTVQQVFPKESQSTVRDISHQIERVHETSAPQYHYYTVTQEAADKQAQSYAKDQKADKIIKTTKEVEIKDTGGHNNAAGNTKDSINSGIIENDFYAISLERKHKINAGVANIDGDNYATLGYRNRDAEYTGYYSPDSKKWGGGVSVTVAKW